MIFVALLRGINVSGQKMVKMELLRIIFAEMQFENIKTYIQTGNVLFSSEKTDQELICSDIEAKLRISLGFEVPVILKTIDELEKVIGSNPFKSRNLLENEKLHVTFLSGVPLVEVSENLNSYKDEVDEILIQGNIVYLLCKHGYGKTRFSNNFLEKKLKVIATSRNLDTLKKIVQLGKV